jgi:molybdopterin-guanine dinucleotide biosynthesis protein A
LSISGTNSNDFCGVILAGGENKRYNGIVKAKLLISGKPIIARTLEVLNPIFDDILIVTNSKDQFSDYSSYKMVSDIFEKVGPLGGLHAALTATSRDAVFMVASDMPLLSGEIIASMLEQFGSCNCEILIPRHNGLDEPLHAIYSRSLLERLDSFLISSKEYAIRDFLKLAVVDYFAVDINNNNPFLNINRPADMAQIEEIMKNI